MAVDRGEMRYGIGVRAGQSFRTLRRFRDELKKTKAAFADFKGELASSSGATSNLRNELEGVQDAIRGVRDETNKQKTASDRTSTAERKAARERQAEVRRRLRNFRRLGRARRARAAETRRQQVEERRLATERARAAAAKARADAKALRDAKRLTDETKKQTSAAGRALFTFRRLFGVLAAFTIARESVSAFTGLIAGGIRFGETIEQSRIGIGGLIAATGEARDAFGELVDPIESLPAAFAAGEDSVRRLRQESLKTVATFDELLKTFQVAVAPGFSAGLELQQIETLAVRVTQAAQALGVPLNQLSEEIRALLTGNITGRTTRIATALGITPDTIRNAREAGNLAQVLEERFRTFGATAESVSVTLTGTFARLRGVFQELTAQASEGLRGELTDALQGLIERFTDLDEATEELSLNPQALQAVTAIFEGVRQVVARLRDIIVGLDFDALGAAASDFGTIAANAFQFLLGALPPILRTLGVMLDIFARLSTVIAPLGPLFGVFLSLQLTLFVVNGLLGKFVALPALAIKAFNGLIASLKTTLELATKVGNALVTGLTKGAESAGAMSRGLTAGVKSLGRALQFASVLALALGAAALAANPLLENLLDMELSLAQSSTLIAESVIVQIKNATLEAQKLGITLSEALGLDTERGFIAGLGESIGRFGAAFGAGVLDLAGADEAAQSIEDALANAIIQDRALAQSRGDLRDIDAEIAALSAEQSANSKELEATLLRIDALNEKRKDQEAEVARLAAKAAADQEQLAKDLEAAIAGITFGPPDEAVTQEEQKRLEALRLSTTQLRLQGVQKRNIALLTANETNQAVLAVAVQRQKINGLEREGAFAQQKLQFVIDELEANRDSARGEARRVFFAEQINLLKAQQLTLENQTNAELTLAERKLQQIVLANEAAARAEQRKLDQIRAGNSELAIATRLLQQQATDVGNVGSAQRRQLADADAQVARQQVQANLQRGATLLAIEELQAKEDQTDAVREQVAALQQKLALEDENAAASLAELERQREIARIRAEGTALEGAGLGVAAFQESLGTVATQLEELVTGVLNTLTQNLGNQLTGAVVQAFSGEGEDPTDSFSDRLEDNLRQVAGSILQQIASQILQTTINMLIQTLLQSTVQQTKEQALDTAFLIAQQTQEATFNTTQRTLDMLNAQAIATLQLTTAQTIATIKAASSGAGAAKGGFIGSGRYSAFAVGGHVHGGLPHTTPPPGVPRSDTVEAYLSPGEFVQRTSAVRTYGLQVMDALNRRLIDPALMKGMLGLKKHSNIVRHASKGPGFQTGGFVSDNIAAAASNITAGAAQEVQSTGGGAVGVPIDTDKFETMLASGKEGFRRFLRDNAADFDGILRTGRTGG